MNKLMLVVVAVAAFTGFSGETVPKSAEKGTEQKSAVQDSVRAAVVARAEKDAAKFDLATRREIERLYRMSSSKGDGSAEALKTLEEKYPEANRTGCAVMYAAQRSRDVKKREEILKRAIEKYGDCFYGDGVQVAAQARWYLSGLYSREGKKDEAKKLLDEIKAKYPDAVTHQGKKFADLIK